MRPREFEMVYDFMSAKRRLAVTGDWILCHMNDYVYRYCIYIKGYTQLLLFRDRCR